MRPPAVDAPVLAEVGLSPRVIRVGGALLVGALAATLAVTLGRRDGGSDPPIRVPGVRVTAFVEPVAHRFADPVTANVEAVVPTRQVDPDALSIAAGFNPYRVVGRTRTESTARDLTTVRWTYRLVCLTAACRPRPGAARTFQFPPVRVSFRRRDGVPRVRRKEWHAVRSVSRLDADEAIRERLSARAFPLPAVTYRVSPGRLSAGALALAALLAALGAALLWRVASVLVVERAVARRLARMGTVARQVAALRAAVERSDDEGRRKALDALALSLARNGNGTEGLAVGARRLAWSERGRPDDALRFADTVEEAIQSEGRR